MTARLITIPFSHYCEKARWALDRCGVDYEEDGHLPLFHYAAVKRAGAKRTVPVVADRDLLLTDSTEICAWAESHKPGELSRTPEALALEDEFDRDLGPATRRWAYFHMLPRKDLDDVVTRGVPRWQKVALRFTRPLAVRMLSRGLNINAAGAERSQHKIDDVFERVAALLATGRRYLTGDRFSIADLAFASLASPVLLPREHPFGLPTPAELGPAAQAQIDAWRATPAGQFGLRLYTEQRAA